MDGWMPHLRLKKNLERQVETKQLKQNFENGHLEGCGEWFYCNGLISCRTNFKKGQQDGLNEVFDENGVLIKSENYTDSKRDGFSTLFSSCGELKERGNWSSGSRIGLFEYYCQGKLEQTLEWQDGKANEWRDGVKIASPIYHESDYGDYESDDDLPF